MHYRLLKQIVKLNVFNSYFELVFTCEPDEIPNKGPSPHPVMGNIDMTTASIISLLHNLNAHKASGPDEISRIFLKELHSHSSCVETNI